MKNIAQHLTYNRSNGWLSRLFRRSGLIFSLLMMACLNGQGQTFFIKENFSNASGTTPPQGWESIRLAGGSGVGFRFDNSTNLQVPYPLQAPFAVFDPTATPWQGTSQTVTLESPEIDLSGVSSLLLSVDHKYLTGSGATGRIQTYADNVWTDVAVLNTSTAGVETATFDVSALLAGKRIGRIRFMWSGKGEGNWLIDNVKLYAPANLDAGISSIDVPKDPFGEGQTDISVSLLNYGSTMLNNTKIRWSVNGVQQPDHNWSGSLLFAQKKSAIRIGQMNLRAGVSYLFKIWSEDPNGQYDDNPSNDTIVRTLIPSLCGTYTIGGNNPNFQTITRAVEFLHSAGIGCPVVMKIRDGVYDEQFELKAVRGSSFVNTITFESESYDTSKVLITSGQNVTSYRYTVNVNGASHVKFRKLSFSKRGDGGYHAFHISQNSSNIIIDSCKFKYTGYNVSNINITDNADSIKIHNNIFEGDGNHSIILNNKGLVSIKNNLFIKSFYQTIIGQANELNIENNVFTAAEAHIAVNIKSYGIISGNKIYNCNDGIHVAGIGFVEIKNNLIEFRRRIGLNVNIQRSVITNNLVTNKLDKGQESTAGINIRDVKNVWIGFNTIRLIKNSKKIAAVSIENSDTLSILNNILETQNAGFPIRMISQPKKLISDRNNYFSNGGMTGEWAGKSVPNSQEWKSLSGGDNGSVFSNPGFSNDSSFFPTLILLNNNAIPSSLVKVDFSQIIRDSLNPDIGAYEFDICDVDASVDKIISPISPIQPGVNPIIISILNNGKKTITETVVSWQIDDGSIKDTLWKGNLLSGKTEELIVGSFDFKPLKGHVIRAWIKIQLDCNPDNDTAYSKRLFGNLCGTYTIGGNNPDFQNIESAMRSLQDAGINCPVILKIRNGIYQEQLELNNIPGASEVNTVTFESESRDSSKVTITNVNSGGNQNFTIRLYDASHIRFKNIAFEIEGPEWYASLLIGGKYKDLEISGCQFETKGGNAKSIYASENGEQIRITGNRFSGSNNHVMAFDLKGSAVISNNTLIGIKEYGITGYFYQAIISGNKIFKFGQGINVDIASQGEITKNSINDAHFGIRCVGTGTVIIDKNRVNANEQVGIYAGVSRSIVSNNWIYNNSNQRQTTSVGVFVEHSKNARIIHNSIFLSLGNKQTSGVRANGGDSISISNNIIAIKQFGIPVYIDNRPPNLYLDYNNYFSPFKVVGWHNNKVYDNLNTWKSIMNVESSGYFGNPYFENDSILVPAQINLNGNGDKQWQIEKDYFDKVRNTSNPDIGAVEFTPCDTDFGLLAFESPTSPLDIGLQKVKIRLQNNGLNPLSSVIIRWTVNGQVQKEFAWQGNLTSAQNTELEIGTFDFRPMTEYSIKVWLVHDPQIPTGKDCNPVNDTLQSIKLYTRLCGNYTIGGANPDFQTIAEASRFLEYAGISCPVVFKIRDGLYNEQVQIDSVMGASRINTITFESASGNIDKVIINGDQPFENPIRHTLHLNGSRHIRIKNLTLSSQGFYHNRTTLKISGTAAENRISDCNFIDKSNGAAHISIEQNADSTQIIRSNFSGWSSSAINLNTTGHVDVNNNLFQTNEWHSINGTAKSLNFIRNQIDGNQLSINLNISDTASILSNTFRQPNNAISVKGSARYLIQFNRIGFRSGTGIESNDIRKGLIANNWIHNITGLSTNGMSLNRSDSIKVLFNSINITGTNNNSSAITIQEGKDNEVFNNILKNASGGYCMKIIGGTDRLRSDYNCYYAPLNNVGSIDERIYNSLSLWGNIISGESNSIFINPFFRSNSEYRPNHILLNDAGVTINPVKHDIDSTLRHPVSPDMGVKEFTPCNNDAGINEFTSPVLPMSAGKQDIRVVLQNQGLGTINSVRIHWSVNGAVQPSFDWMGNLPTRKNVEVQIGQMEFLAGPEWTIRAWTSQPNGIADCNNYNDTTLLFVPGTPNSVPYPPTARDTSVCIGNTATLYAKGVGRLSWYTAPTGGTWLGSDSIFITPPLNTTTTYYVQDSVLKASLARTPVKVTVFTPPPFDAIPDKIYSRADVYTLGIDTSLKGYNHRWSTGDSTATIQVTHSGGFRVRFTTPDGCRLTDSVFVQFPDTASLRAGIVTGSCIVPVEVPVSVGNFRRITHFKGELSWDTARLSFDSIRTYANLGMQGSDFNTSLTGSGRLPFSWTANGTNWKSLPDSTIIFAVRLVPTTAVLGNLPINLSTDTSRYSFYNDQPKRLSTTAFNGAVNVTTCLMQLEGKVITPLDEGVVNVQMNLSGPESRQTMTRQDGSYLLSATKGIYSLTPFKNNEKEKLNGISTLDLALIQSHILLRQRLGNAYKVIAADVNQSGSVTTVDIMHLRRMLLRMDSSLPGNRTWAFVDADRTFSNPNAPFPFPQNTTLAERFGKVSHTFRAIKLGDVNYDRNPKLDQTWGRDTLKLIAETKELPGLRHRVILRTEGIEQLMGFQGTLSWDSSSHSLLSINANPMDISLGEGSIQQGQLLFSWNDPKALGLNFSKGTTLLELIFQGKTNFTCPILKLKDDVLATEAFNSSFQKINMNLTMPQTADGTQRDGTLRLYPNPAKSQVTATWRSVHNGAATLKILDATGRTVWSRSFEQYAGLNEQTYAIPKGISNGLYLFRLETNTSQESIQLIIER